MGYYGDAMVDEIKVKLWEKIGIFERTLCDVNSSSLINPLFGQILSLNGEHFYLIL